MVTDPALQLTAVATLCLVFATAAIGKMSAWSEFQGVVQNYRLLPGVAVPAVAWALPPAELGLALLLLVESVRAPAAAGMAVLLVVFAAAMAVNIARGRTHIDCGCFRSALVQRLSWWLVLRNLLLLGLALVCALPAGERVLSGTDWLTVLGGAGCLFLAYLGVGYVTLPPPPTLEEIAAARAGQGAPAARSSSRWKAL